ncbi:hypothetical protein [Pedobacter duraquae]|uniref:hypothetical protein n=1 Tax=Pedobacter duraquae TaxID=425511 RepID=UPI001414D8E7|nr:hypothetical protein [Pedobacter duraquae]
MSSNNINYFQSTSLNGGIREWQSPIFAKQHQLFPEHVAEGVDPGMAESIIWM